eukprot:1768551-Pleurochrysis_carterae.AAC.1
MINGTLSTKHIFKYDHQISNGYQRGCRRLVATLPTATACTSAQMAMPGKRDAYLYVSLVAMLYRSGRRVTPSELNEQLMLGC